MTDTKRESVCTAAHLRRLEKKFSHDYTHDPTDKRFLRIMMRGHTFEVEQNYIRMYAEESRLNKYLEFLEATGALGTVENPPEYHCNRNPYVFHGLYDYYVTGELHLPSSFCGRLVKDELEYWEIGLHYIMPCCLQHLNKPEQTLIAVKHIQSTWRENVVLQRAKEKKTWKSQVENFLDNPASSILARIYYLFYVFVALFSMGILGWQSIIAARDPRDGLENISMENMTNYGKLRVTAPPRLSVLLDLATFIIIYGTFVLRYVASVSNKEFFSDPFNTLELITNTPQWLPIIQLVATGAAVVKASYIVENIMFVFAVYKATRVIPFIRAMRYYRGMRMMANALASSFAELIFLAIVLLVGSLLFGYAIYVSELYSNNTQMDGLPDAMWWGVITMTTVGYGDIIPSTWIGKMVGFLCAISGILMVALPVPIIATKFYKLHDDVGITDLSTKLLMEDIKKQKEEEEEELREAMAAEEALNME